MAPEARRTKFTREDLVNFPDDGLRHEIVGGEHCVTPAPSTRHQRMVASLYRVLDAHARGRSLGEVFIAPLDVVLSDTDVVAPDLMFVSKAKERIIGERDLRGAPDLVIEVLSETTRRRDETVKKKLYERSGVTEYWTVDPELETVRIFRLEGGAYGRPLELSREGNDALESPLLPGLRVRLSDLFG